VGRGPNRRGWALAIAAAAPMTAALAFGAEGGYRLEPGTRLVYRVILEREVRSAPGAPSRPQTASRAEWTSHVVVIGGGPDARALGFQRNRTSAELLSWRENGRERVASRRGQYLAQWESVPARFAEGNVLDSRGRAAQPWSAAREAYGDLLVGLHEIVPLGEGALAAGTSWAGTFPLGLTHRVSGPEQVGGRECVGIATEDDSRPLTMDWVFCPDLGAIERARFSGEYFDLGARIDDTWSIELLERHDGETIADWLEAPEIRLAALEAMHHGGLAPFPTERLHALLEGEDVEAARRSASLIFRLGLAVPPEETRNALAASGDARLRRLATRLGEPPRPAPEIPAGALPDWFCAEEPGWPERLLRSIERPARPPGFAYLRMQSPEQRGRPWAMYVPDDYRGDRPRPLLIYLSGGSGRLGAAVHDAVGTIEELGWLVAVPQADGFWWQKTSTGIVRTLLDEILRGYAVDTNRVYVTGFSNGGTGTLHFATLWPQRFAAAASLMGAGLYPMDAEPPLGVNARAIPLLFVHGKRDEQIAWQVTRDTVRRLEREPGAAPLRVRYLPDRGHDLLLSDDGGYTLPFLREHVRDPLPRRVLMEIRDLDDPRRYWIEVVDKDRGVARIDARIGPDGAIEIESRNVRRIRLLLRRELMPEDSAPSVRINGREMFSAPLARDCAVLHRSLGSTADPWLAWSAELALDVPR